MTSNRNLTLFSCRSLKVILFGLAFITFFLLYVTFPESKSTANTSFKPTANELQKFTNTISKSTTKKPSTKKTPKATTVKKPKTTEASMKNNQCPSVLEGMTLGKWHTPKLTKEQFHERWQEIKRATSRMPIYHNLQRPDGKCGNETFRPAAPYVRALCDPEGDSPCCENHVCVSKSVHECRCKGCIDLRIGIVHPKYAKWIPHDRRCKFTQFSSTELCKLFDGWSVHFVGDSLMDQMSTAMFVMLSGDFKNGALLSNSTKDIRKKCQFDKQFDNGGDCKANVKREGKLCGGHVQFKKHNINNHSDKDKLNTLIKNIQNKPKTLVFISVGIHDNCRVDVTMNEFLKESFDKLKKENSTWPHVIFGTVPAPGPLKSPIFKRQSWDSVLRYNNGVTKMLKQRYNITSVDFFPMSQGVMPYDGIHFGMYYTLNRLNLLFHYFKEWKHNSYKI